MKRHVTTELPFDAVRDKTLSQALARGYDEVGAAPGKNSPRYILSRVDTLVRDWQKTRQRFWGRLLLARRDQEALGLALGTLVGWQLVQTVGWRWAILLHESGERHAVVSPDGAQAIFPLEFLSRCLSRTDIRCDMARVLAMLERQKQPPAAPGSYLDLLASR